MDIDTDQLKAALDSDILILDCRREGKYIFLKLFMVFTEFQPFYRTKQVFVEIRNR